MLDLFALIAMFLRTILASASQLQAENLFLRYQLQVYRRSGVRPRFQAHDRQILSTLTRGFRAWREACFAVRPETILAWHKRLVRWKWTFRTRLGRPAINHAVSSLAVRMKRSNPLWGAKRLHGELLKLGYRLSESSVRNILRCAGCDPGGGPPSLTWRQFLGMHKTVWAIDLFAVESAFLKTYFVLVVIDVHSRVLVATRVADRADGQWVTNVLRSEMAERGTPDLVIHDHGSVFRTPDLRQLLRSRGVHSAMTPVYAPRANAYVERVIGSIRRECTDHFLFSGRKHLQGVLDEYRKYYNTARCHQGIDQRIPLPGLRVCPSEPPAMADIKSHSFLGGLHHDYFVAG